MCCVSAHEVAYTNKYIRHRKMTQKCFLGPVHMGKSFPGERENISTSSQARSRLLRKIVSKVTLGSYETKSFPVYQDLAC